MRAAIRLLQSCRITLFMRSNCSLCDNAKQSLSQVWDARPFAYREINVMDDDQGPWRDLYEFDTPVIHVRKANEEDLPDEASKAKKLMHRFTPEEVHKIMDLVDAK